MKKLMKYIYVLMIVAGVFSPVIAQDSTAPQITHEEVVLMREINTLRVKIDKYDRYQQTYIPDNWRMPVIQKLIALSDWSLSEKAEQAEWCGEFMKDIQIWENMEVIEPYIMSNSFDHVALEEYHYCSTRSSSNNPHYYSDSYDYPAYCSSGFRVYDVKQGENEERLDFFTCFDGVAKGKASSQQAEQAGNLDKRIIRSGGNANFTSPSQPICFREGLSPQKDGVGGGIDRNSMFPLISLKNYKLLKSTFGLALYGDFFVLKHNKNSVVMNFGFVSLGEDFKGEGQIQSFARSRRYINVYLPPQTVDSRANIKERSPQCVLEAPLGVIEEILGGNE